MDTSKLINKFKNGTTLSNKELLVLNYELSRIEGVLISQGSMFYPTRRFVSDTLSVVKSICKARNLL